MKVDQEDIDILYEEQEANETFRDHLATVDDKGKRIWLYPKKPSGRYFNRRAMVSFLLLAFLITGPFIRIGGEPMLLFNVFDRRFVILGQVFWPQDFFLFAIGFITILVFIILFTVVYGRVFCGWICPQTIFMEFVFRRIEYAIEGDYTAQRKLDKEPWHTGKVMKKTAKHLLFIAVSAVIMHTFMAYLIGTEQTWEIISNSPAANPGGFIAMVVLTAMFYGVFSKMREQVCTTICPYGRLQGVLLDKNSMVVAYDYKRGEERGKLRKNQDREAIGLGDCIDCKQCVFVCPTGIDIRNGTQMECVNCTACTDACDSIMDKVGKPRGLVRYATENGISEEKPFKFTKRMLAYSIVLALLVLFSGSQLLMRADVETTIMRTPGVLYQKRDDGMISNLYNLKVINKTSDRMNIRLAPVNDQLQLEVIGGALEIAPNGTLSSSFFLIADPENLTEISSTFKIEIYSGDEKIETVKTRFLGPAN
ncbi:MAG: cytochrome c oxidase accessory protein CcoG [Cyclobacteriaceae bacterium]